MNMQKRSDERSIALHREIAKKLRADPTLWNIPKHNIIRWKNSMGGLAPAVREWENVLNTRSREQILSVLESDSEESVRLRSSSPFTGILSARERKRIFESYKMKRTRQGHRG